jgi:hypothetical protein
MTLPSDGSISFSQINLELGRPANASYSLNDGDIRKLASVGGTNIQTNNDTYIPFSSLRGHAWNVVTINSPITNYTYAAPAPGKTYGVLNVTGSGVIGSTSTESYALIMQSLPGDLLTVQNSGYIVGAGGNGAHGGISLTSGSNGGSAILVQGGPIQHQNGIIPNIIIQNNGIIGGGGGGGGGGQWVQDTQNQHHVPISGGGGGGGAGYIPGYAGDGGNAGGYGPGQAGQVGTLTTGGGAGQSRAGQGGGNGGNGGNLGQAGQTGADGRQGTGYGPRAGGSGGGAAGNALVGKTYLVDGSITSGNVYGNQV